MNAVDPERIVAEHNLQRARSADAIVPLDLDYLDRLSADAAPTVLAAIDALDAEEQSVLVRRWCTPVENNGFGWNRAVQKAARAQAEFCP